MVEASFSLQLKTRDQALLLASVLLERDGAGELLRYLPRERAEEIRPELEEIQRLPAKSRIVKSLERLKLLMDSAYTETIEEIHPSWISQHLQEQPAPLAALLLAALPPRFQAKVAGELPPPLAARLGLDPAGKPLPPPPRQELLKALLARRFELLNRLSGAGRDRFEFLFSLNSAELSVLIEELGTSELAMALQGMPEKDFQAVCQKLAPKLQDKIRVKIAQYAHTTPERVQQSRESFLHLKDELYQRGRLIEFTGLHMLARALIGVESDRVHYVAFKLPVLDGQLLLKLLARFAPEAAPEADLLAAIRAEVAEKIAYLAEIDRIRSLWKYY